MKKMSSAILAVVILCFVICPFFASAASTSDNSLIGTNDFLLYFNLYAASTNLGHTLSTESADEIAHFPDHVMFKTIFNGCEILTLILSADSSMVTSIKCTWSTLTPGADKYSDDFLYLLMEVLCSCGLSTDSIADVFTTLGANNAFDVGDSGNMTVDGIEIGYEVTSAFGVSFTIKRA